MVPRPEQLGARVRILDNAAKPSLHSVGRPGPPILFPLLTVLSPCENIDSVSKLFEVKGDEKLAGIIEHIPLPNRHGNQTSIAKG